ADRAPRTGEAGADAAPAAHQGPRRRALWRPGARRPAARSGVPRHRGAAAVLPGTRHRRSARAAASRLAVHRGRRIAVLADAGVQGRLWRGGGRMDAAGCTGLLEDRRPHGRVPHPRRATGEAAAGERLMMRSVVVDKIGSVTQALNLKHELRISDEIPAEEGVVLVVEVLTNKSTYNTLELTSGRMAKVARGDIVVGALGPRRALFGYSGNVPSSVKVGDVIQMLNIGGVLGKCTSVNPDRGQPFDCRVLGVVLQFPYLGERIGVPARVGSRKLDQEAKLDARNVPVVALAGTCMEAGKTAAACSIVARMRH